MSTRPFQIDQRLEFVNKFSENKKFVKVEKNQIKISGCIYAEIHQCLFNEKTTTKNDLFSQPEFG